MLRLLRSEIFRLRRRWMPWIILGLIILVPFLVYFLVWVSVRAQLEAIRSGQIPAPPEGTAQIEEVLRQIAPDRIQDFGVGLVGGLGGVMLVVFAASLVGTEFGWGTLRTLLAHGAGRGGFLAAKAVALALYAVLFTLVGTIAAIAASYAVSSIAGISTAAGLNVTEVASVAARGAYTFVPYMALAVVIAVWSRSAGAGIAAGLVVLFAESIVANLLVSLNRDYATIVNYGLSRNATSLTRTSTPSTTPDPSAFNLPDMGQAALVLAIYTAVFLALAYWRLRTRDVTLA